MALVRKYVFDGGGIPTNHIVNLSPDQQRVFAPGSTYVMAGHDKNRDPEGAGGSQDVSIANAWYLVKSQKPGYPTFQSVGWATGNSGGGPPGTDLPDFPLYGLLGTAEEGVMYDPLLKRFYRMVDDSGLTGLTTGTATGLPPGPGQGVNAPPTAQAAIEFSVADDGFWVAKTPGASAANKDGNPHPGISIINPGAWEQYAAGLTVEEALSLDDYKDAGWLGLNKRFLAFQGGTDVSPAGEELASAMDAAMAGDTGAQRALRAVGVSPPKQKKGLSLDLGGSFNF